MTTRAPGHFAPISLVRCDVSRCRLHAVVDRPKDPMQHKLCAGHVEAARKLLREDPGLRRRELLELLAWEARRGS